MNTRSDMAQRDGRCRPPIVAPNRSPIVPPIVSLTAQSDALFAKWQDGASARIPHLWLRHNCGCEQCVVRQTSEKRFQIFTVAADLKPERARLADGPALVVDWPDGHRSRFSSQYLRAALHAPPASLRHWDGAFKPHRVDFDDFLADDSAAAACIEAFLATGACVLTNGPTTPNALERLAPRLGPVREVLFERIHNVLVDPTGYNIAHTSEDVPPHNDMVSYAWPPSVQALHMLANDCRGGETGIVDGFRVLEGLRRERPGMFEVLCAVDVPFRQFDANNETSARAPTIALATDGSLKTLRYSNQLMQRMALDEPRLAEFYRAFHELAARLNDPTARARLRLDAGQVLLIAGHRVLHARERIAGGGRRHLQDAYFEHDNVRNHLTLLRRRRSNGRLQARDEVGADSFRNRQGQSAPG